MKFDAMLAAGGKSTRMGVDKATLLVDGAPLWKRQLATLRRLNPDSIFLSGPRSREWAEAGVMIIEDTFGSCGPLGGLASVLSVCHSPHLVVLAVDMPQMTTEFLESLVADCRPGVGVVPKNGQYYEPLAAVYPVGSLGIAASRIASGELALQGFVQQLVQGFHVRERGVSAAEQPLFANWNRPENVSGGLPG